MTVGTEQEKYMRRAIGLAWRGRGYTSPNPMVGAVIVKDGQIIGEGWHERYGQLHAERNALAACSEDPAGAELYVTLEPCCHHGKTPPCTDAIIQAKIGHVYVGSMDPNPRVDGGGIRRLREAGVAVTEGVMKEECDAINPVFFHYIRTGRPFVTLKYAMTADGKIATRTGASRWITGEEARRDVHRLRHEYTAIMAGVGTVISDDPMLNCRLDPEMEGLVAEARDPIRVICDTNLRIPMDSQIVQTAGEIRTIIARGETDDRKKQEQKEMLLKEAGCEPWPVPVASTGSGETAEGIDPDKLLERLGNEGIDSVLIEGGGTLAWSMLSRGLINQVICYMAPKIFGGTGAKTPVEGSGFETPDQAVAMELLETEQLGEDIKLTYCVNKAGNELPERIG